MHLNMRLKILLALVSWGVTGLVSAEEPAHQTPEITGIAPAVSSPNSDKNETNAPVSTDQSGQTATTDLTTNSARHSDQSTHADAVAPTPTDSLTPENHHNLETGDTNTPEPELAQLLELANQSFTQREQIEALLERLVLVVNKNALKLEPATQTTIRNQLVALRQLVRQVKNATALNPTAVDLAFAAKVDTAVLATLQTALQQNLSTIPTVDLAAIQASMTRGATPQLADITQTLATNKSQLEKIVENSYNLGISWSQKLYKNSCEKFNGFIQRLDQATEKFKGYRHYVALAAIYGAYKLLAPRDNAFERQLNTVGIDTHPGFMLSGYLAGEALRFGAKEAIEHSNAYAHPLFTSFASAGLALGVNRATNNQAPLSLLDLPLFRQEKLVRTGAMGLYWAASKGIYRALKPKVQHALYDLDRRLKGLEVQDDKSAKLEVPKVSFKDVIGNQEIKTKFQVVIDYVTQPDKFDSAGLTPEKGYLLIGGSRAGKSFMAKALAGEINLRRAENKPLNFLPVTANDIMWWGWPRLMELVKYHAPCVVFIDEIDLLNLNRTDHGKPNELLSNMLTWMAGDIDADPTKQVIVLAATNRPDKLDFALRQHGRFGEIIPFRYPTYAERVEFLQRKLDYNGLTGTLPADLIDQIARETADKPYDDLAAIMNLAQQTAMAQIRPVQAADFQAALDHYVHRIAAENAALSLSETEQKLIAAHQAGRTLATLLLTPADRISLVTTAAIEQKIPEQAVPNDKCYKPTVQYGSTITYPTRQKTIFNTEQELERLIQIDLAGHLAQELLLGTCSYQYQAEEQHRALAVATEIVLAGQKSEDLSPTILSAKKDLALKLQEVLKVELKTALAKYQDLLQLIYAALLKQQTLREAELYELVSAYQAAQPKADNNTTTPTADQPKADMVAS